MGKGEILFSPKYEFDNGQKVDKLFIVLNEPENDDPYLLIRATSQQWKRSMSKGCHSDEGYYVILKGEDWFDRERTWILFDPVLENDCSEFLKSAFMGKFISMTHLKDGNLTSVINCMLGSSDVMNYHKDLLRKTAPKKRKIIKKLSEIEGEKM